MDLMQSGRKIVYETAYIYCYYHPIVRLDMHATHLNVGIFYWVHPNARETLGSPFTGVTESTYR